MHALTVSEIFNRLLYSSVSLSGSCQIKLLFVALIIMGINIDILFDYLGRLKLATVVVGFLDLLLIGYSYYKTDARDQAFLSAVVVCFVFSFTLVVGVVLEYVVVSDFFIRIEMVFHSAACLLLLGTDTFFLISILKHGKLENFGVRILAMTFGYINAAVYGYLPWTLIKST